MLRLSRRLLVLLNILNWAAIAFLVTVFVSLAAGLPWAEARLVARHAGNVELARHNQQAMMLIGVGIVVCTHVIFTRLIAVIDAVIAGMPFLDANARRLRDIAWALFGIQLLDLGVGALTLGLMRSSGRVALWSPSITGWLGVLLLFVLARIFAQGARMQHDLEGTV